MARSYAAIHHRIWADPDWRSLDLSAQHLYVLLISQPQMNLAGVLPLQLRKWASCVDGWDIGDVAKALDRLAEARFVLVDEDTEEVLIRSLVRNDGSYKIPNVLKSLLQSAEGTQSQALRAELSRELGRLDSLEGKKAEESAGLIAATRLVLGGSKGPSGPGGEPLPEPLAEPLPEGLGEGFIATHAVTVTGTVNQPIAQPLPQGSGSGSGSGKGVSLVGIMGGKSTPTPLDEPPNCARHEGMGANAPGCRACQRLRENWEMARDEAAKPKPKPPWCGKCDEASRKVEVEIDGRDAMRNCETCHPLAGVA